MESRLDVSVEHTLDKAITEMPTRKRELLIQEARAGATVEITRSTKGA
jgi:hypothetical protein